MPFLDERFCIVGVGETAYSRNSGRTTHALAVEAVQRAAGDAGLATNEIDGLMCYHENDSVQPYFVATDLGAKLSYYMDTPGGGNATEALIGTAAAVIDAGLANVVGIYRSLNARSGLRIGGTGGGFTSARKGSGEAQFWLPFGHSSAPATYALFAHAHMHRYGTTKAQLGAVAVNARRNADLNPKAVLRGSLTLEDYFAARPVVDPFNVMDCCLETDGACALIVTSAERAKTLRQRPIYVSGVVGRACAPLARWLWAQEDPLDWPGREAGDRVFDMAGVTRRDIDVAAIYDCFSFTVINELENLGFCGKGEGGAFVEEGRIGLEGDLPLNLNGGLLAEAYANGMNNVVELVRQLRGTADDDRGDSGSRQKPGAEIALSAASLPMGYASAMILRR